MSQKTFPEFIAVDEARRLIAGALPGPGPAEEVPLAAALGRTLAGPVASEGDLPPFANSAMDGYALRATEASRPPATLRVVGEAAAGVPYQGAIPAGCCVRIMTGAPFPADADAVVPVEWTEAEEDERVRVVRAPEPGSFVRAAGADVRAGTVVFEGGELVTPPVVGMLAALGSARVSVRRPPRVAVVATGDELVDASALPGPGQIRNANGPALAAQVAAAGGAVVGPLLARDDRRSIREAIDAASTADLVVFSGGVSVGRYDLVRQVLDEAGLELLFWKVRQRPGKPLAFGRLRGKPVFGLPGNPVSSTVCFEQYVRPAIARMLGRKGAPASARAVLASAIRKAPGLHHFVRGRAVPGEDGRWLVDVTGDQASNIYTSIVRSNCFVHLPEEVEDPQAGSVVEIEWLAW